MRILIFNTFYYPKLVGGAEVSVQLLAESLVEKGNEVFVASLAERDGKNKHNGVTNIQVKERNIYSIIETENAPIFKKILYHLIDSNNFLIKKKIKQILLEVQPDVIHTNNLNGFSPIVWKIAKQSKIPIVHTMRDYYLICHKCKLYKNDNCKSLCNDCKISKSIKVLNANHVHTFIGISNFILSKHEEFNFIDKKISQTKVIYNAINPIAKINESAPNEVEIEKLVFGFIGRITPEKGLDFTVKSFNNLTGNNCKYLIAGKIDALYQQEIEKLAKRKELINFLGFQKQAEFFAKIDVLIVPSLWYEPFGRVVIEALSYGIPVIISNRGGLKELFNNTCMWMFDPETDELDKILKHLIYEPAEVKEKAKFAKNYAENFTSANIANKYFEAYKEAVNG